MEKVDFETSFIDHRLQLWDKLCISVKSTDQSGKIVVCYQNDKLEFDRSKTFRQVADFLNLKDVVGCSVDSVMTDLWRTVEDFSDGITVKFFTFSDPEGQKVFWHSSAHVLGQALEIKYGIRLSVGPALDGKGGHCFYYEGGLSEGQKIGDKDLKELEKIMFKIVKQKQPFQRLVVNKDDALEMFKHNKYKQEIIQNKVPNGETCTVYRCGPFVDLCKGPHLENTGLIKAIKLRMVSSSYFLGDNKRDTLQRVYGVSFPDKKQLKDYVEFIEEAHRRDHRRIGIEQELLYFDSTSPGSAFLLPNGVRIYNRMMQFIKDEYWDRGFEEVITPNIFKSELWKISGHWDKYKDDMFTLKCDDEHDKTDETDDKKDDEEKYYCLKPMNCPSHCLIFKSKKKSYRDLPIRYADFGALHRNEMAGALTGLTRVRKFHQDDAHIFCREDQIGEEIDNCFEFLDHVYTIFGFKFALELSTRPDNYIGDLNLWNNAETILEKQLDKFCKAKGMKWNKNEGDGAFYGPKIDIHIEDALRRSHQCATIQLDFNLPQRFKLTYRDKEDKDQRPVIIHRAIYGSFERFLSILIEHLAGKWPLWLSPKQIAVVPISEKFLNYGDEIKSKLHKNRYYVDVDDSDNSINKKIRNAQVGQYNYILVVGQNEVDNNTVNVRLRDGTVVGEMVVDELINRLNDEIKEYR